MEIHNRLSVRWSVGVIMLCIYVKLTTILVEKVTTSSLQQHSDRSASETYRFASITTDYKQCSTVGMEIMARKGGSAVDAAIAAAICLGVVQPHSSGIAGGSLMLIYDVPRGGSQMEWKSLVARGTAPPWAHRDLFKNVPAIAQERGIMSILVPGELNGYYEAWKRYGRVKWKDLFLPSIDIARNGWNVSESLALAIRKTMKVTQDVELRSQYTKEDGQPFESGELLTDVKLAATLQRIADDPTHVGSFYNGSLARDLLDDLRKAGGNFTVEDLMSNKVQWDDPLELTFKNGYKLFGTVFPSSSSIVGFLLKVIEGYTPTPDLDCKKRGLLLHRLTEAYKLAFQRRTFYLGDPKFVNKTHMKQWLHDITDDDYIRKVRFRIKDDSVSNNYHFATADAAELSGGTTHITAASPIGGYVTLSSTVGNYFGSKMRGEKTGIIFNNGFSIFNNRSTMAENPLDTANNIEGGKTPRTTSSGVMITDKTGRPVLAIGASGGGRIVASLTQVISDVLWNGMNISEAVDQPRVYSDNSLGNILLHDPLPQDIQDELKSRGHNLQIAPFRRLRSMGVVQAIDSRDCYRAEFTGRPCLHAVSDRRKQGAPDGY